MGEVLRPSRGGAERRLLGTRSDRAERFPSLDRFTYDGREIGRQCDGPLGSMTRQDTGDQARMTALRAGDPAPVAQFLKDISATVWTGCCLLAGEEPEAREAFIETMALLR